MRLRNLLRPVYLVRRTAYWFYQRGHPDDPWLAQGAIRYLDEHLRPEFSGFEWGSGRSTAWFATRVGSLVSIEENREWHDKVAAMLREKKHASRIDLRHIPVEHEFRDQYFPCYDPVPKYVLAIEEFPDASFDFILVDGCYRQSCVRAAMKKLKPGGLLIIDNTDWLPVPQWNVPYSWPVEHQSRNVLSQTTIWRKPAGSPSAHPVAG